MDRLAVVAPNWLGDAVMALPALADLRRHHASARLIVAARAAVAPFYTLAPGVDEIVTLPGRGGIAALSSRGVEDAAALAAAEADVAVLLPNSFASALAARRARIPERWGFRTDLRGRLLTMAVPRPRGRLHQGAYYQALTAALGVPTGPPHARVELTEAAARGASALLEAHRLRADAPFVALAPGAAYGRAKQWLPERFAELSRDLADQGVTPVLVGSAADAAVCHDIAALVQDALGHASSPLVDLSGRTNVPTLAGVLARARACVSNDSGAMHLAAAVGTQALGIFGATDPGHTAPLPRDEAGPAPLVVSAPVWCRPCMLRECPIDHRCMRRVTAGEVMENLKLGPPGAPHEAPADVPPDPA